MAQDWNFSCDASVAMSTTSCVVIFFLINIGMCVITDKALGSYRCAAFLFNHSKVKKTSTTRKKIIQVLPSLSP